MNPLQELSAATTRQARQLSDVEKPIVCPECGSNWFTEATYNQYSSLAYGSGTGGDIRVISNMPQTLRICLCGHPYTPNLLGIRGRAATAELATLNASLAAAQKMREAILQAGKQPPVNMQALAQSFVGVNELQELKKTFEGLIDRISGLEAAGIDLSDAQASILGTIEGLKETVELSAAASVTKNISLNEESRPSLLSDEKPSKAGRGKQAQ